MLEITYKQVKIYRPPTHLLEIIKQIKHFTVIFAGPVKNTFRHPCWRL